MKTVLITGASGGIGVALCRKFASEGYIVGVNYNKNARSATEISKEVGGLLLPFDVTDGAAAERGIKEFAEKCGHIDALVNNAGVAIPIKPLLDVTDEEYEMAFSVNVKGVYNCTKSVLPYMLGRGGSIVNISSMWGITGGSCEAVYSATKGAVIAFTKALAKEYVGANIRVNAVAPGFIDTKMNSALSPEDRELELSEIPLGRAGKPEEVAEAVFFLTEKATFSTGEVLGLSGGQVV
ncbi:MAG: SDR family oxidoreductase [Clostridia bacterium]|nr:SDR family oxidoreductase [Clostridia bacterium]